MGRSVRVRYTVQLDVEVADGFGGTYVTPAAWRAREHGRPTLARLSDYVDAFVASLDGVNARLKQDLGVVGVRSATIKDHDTGEVVAQWLHPRLD